MRQKNVTYFAARNGFDGFTSYFSSVFSPSNFSKIFILKGGPGTGKSTLMRRIRDALSPFVDEVHTILCSSDPRSLDGLILSKDERRIAILDGTAPHMTDPSLPVACEEIINLADAIREEDITSHKRRLAELLGKKQEEYRFAYQFMLVCGEIKRNYSAVCKNIDQAVDEEGMIERVLSAKIGRVETRLYTCFGKDGEGKIDIQLPENTQVIALDNNIPFSEYLLSFVREKKIESILVPSCYDGEISMLYIPSVSLCISFSDSRVLEEDVEEIYSDSLTIARSHFAKASEYHFQMEDIYSHALDFSILDNICLTLTEKMKVLFSIS